MVETHRETGNLTLYKPTGALLRLSVGNGEGKRSWTAKLVLIGILGRSLDLVSLLRNKGYGAYNRGYGRY